MTCSNGSNLRSPRNRKNKAWSLQQGDMPDSITGSRSVLAQMLMKAKSRALGILQVCVYSNLEIIAMATVLDTAEKGYVIVI